MREQAEKANLYVRGNNTLFVGGGVFHTAAKGLGASETWWAGQAVVAGICVLTPVLSIVVEAGIRDFFALWKTQPFVHV